MFLFIFKFVLTVATVAGVHYMWRKTIVEEKRKRELEDSGQRVDTSNPLNPHGSLGNKNPWPLLAVIVTVVALFFTSMLWSPINEHQPTHSRDIQRSVDGPEYRSLSPPPNDPLQ